MAKTPKSSDAPAATASDPTPETPAIGAPKAASPEAIAAAPVEAAPITASEEHGADGNAAVVCLVRAPAGPRRRAGLAFGLDARPLTRADLGGTDEAIRATLDIIAADPKLSLLPA